ncbi:MAG: 2-succinyl-6-hydroxy-2,4-cyclohexadiene-1-carboxylate synthase [Gemmatimonadetes bacterium]|nr:MAG: 2-succinyl-6-hydroxy-2,4-cyclohexadiene-1-carboxylate synthase [Gemmatimonadota bacterium]
MSTLYYDTTGNPNNPAILFLHGFMGRGTDWRDISTQLADNFYGVMVDLPGHGQTTLDDHHLFTMENSTKLLVNLLDTLGLPAVHLAGYSMGGRLALYVALHHLHRVKTLVLESASPGLKTAAERHQRRAHDAHLAQKLETIDFTQFLTEWYHLPLWDSLREHPRFNEIRAKKLQNQPHLLAKSLREMGTGVQPSLWEKWAAYRGKTVLITGGRDSKFSHIAQEMVTRNPQAVHRLVPTCGHNVHVENPAEFLHILRAALCSPP